MGDIDGTSYTKNPEKICMNVWHDLPPSHAFDEDICPSCGEQGLSESAVPACLWGPSRCMDDLCRNSDIGLCGLRDEDFIDDEEWPDEV